jgi:hypothetical protein
MKLPRVQERRWAWVLLACTCALSLNACGPTRLTIKNDIPPLLMTPLPVAMGVRLPKTFAGYVQKETDHEREWQINLGAAQADAFRRVTAAMFESTLVLGDRSSSDAAAIADHKLKAILEPSLDSYVYLLPTEGGGPEFYSATIGYKVNLESVDGTVIGSWIYEGYGSAPARGISDATGIELVTRLAIRDAVANLAAHMPDQELIRNLLAPETSAPASTPTTNSSAAPASTEAPNSATPVATPAPQSAPPPSSAAAPASNSTNSAAPLPAPETAPNSTPSPQSSLPAPTAPAVPNPPPDRPPASTPSPEPGPTPPPVQPQPVTGT